jgi:hypothetical protein
MTQFTIRNTKLVLAKIQVVLANKLKVMTAQQDIPRIAGPNTHESAAVIMLPGRGLWLLIIFWFSSPPLALFLKRCSLPH